MSHNVSVYASRDFIASRYRRPGGNEIAAAFPQSEEPGKEGREDGRVGYEHDYDEMDDQEGGNIAADIHKGFFEAVGGEEQVKSHRGGQEAQLQVDDEDDAQVYGIDAVGRPQRNDEGKDDEDGGKDVHEAAHHEERQVQEQQEQALRSDDPQHPVRQFHGDIGVHNVVRKGLGKGQNRQNPPDNGRRL